MATNRNTNQRIKALLYELKRLYGGRVDIYKKLTASSNAQTGERTVTKSVLPIERAIVLPEDVARDLVRSISLISANKQLVMGGFYDTKSRVIIVDRRDAPTLSLTQDDWIVYRSVKYQIESFDSFDLDAAWVISAKALIGEVPQQIHLVRADNTLALTQTAGSQ